MTVILDQGGPRDPNALPLSTRCYTHIHNEPRQELLPALLNESVVAYQREYPNAVLRSLTAVYNCLGLTFAARRTCIEPDYAQMILAEDGYSRLQGVDQAQIGDLVVYKHSDEDAHIGIVIRIEDPLAQHRKLFVLSKWGPFGEYTHPIEEVPPLFGQPHEFWTDRRLEDDLSGSAARN